MAVSNVSTVDVDNWQLINTVGPALTGTSVTVGTGLTSWKKLMIVWSNVDSSNTDHLMFSFNGNTSGYVGGTGSLGENGYYKGNGGGLYVEPRATQYGRQGYMIVDYTLSSGPKVFYGSFHGANYATFEGAWNNTSAVTSVQMFYQNGNSFSGGISTLWIYGIAA